MRIDLICRIVLWLAVGVMTCCIVAHLTMVYALLVVINDEGGGESSLISFNFPLWMVAMIYLLPFATAVAICTISRSAIQSVIGRVYAVAVALFYLIVLILVVVCINNSVWILGE